MSLKNKHTVKNNDKDTTILGSKFQTKDWRKNNNGTKEENLMNVNYYKDRK